MTIFYKFEGKLYANITNKCPCACVFCIRKNGDSVADNDSLKKTVLPQEDREIPLLNGAERKVIAGKIKKIMNQDLR